MNEFPEVASVHESTLRTISVNPPVRKKKVNTTVKNRRVSEVSHIKVDPRVWKEAMRLCKGDKKRLRINSRTSVTVLNPRNE